MSHHKQEVEEQEQEEEEEQGSSSSILPPSPRQKTQNASFDNIRSNNNNTIDNNGGNFDGNDHEGGYEGLVGQSINEIIAAMNAYLAQNQNVGYDNHDYGEDDDGEDEELVNLHDSGDDDALALVAALAATVPAPLPLPLPLPLPAAPLPPPLSPVVTNADNNNNNAEILAWQLRFEHAKLITHSDVSHGVDIQGIPWLKFDLDRENQRKMRVNEYQPYQNITREQSTLSLLSSELTKIDTESRCYFEYRQFTRTHRPRFWHFQLRNMLWTPTKNDLYFLQQTVQLSQPTIACFDIISGSMKKLYRKIDKPRYNNNYYYDYSNYNYNYNVDETSLSTIENINDDSVILALPADFNATTLCCNEDLVACGGSKGELLVTNPLLNVNHFNSIISQEETPITNAIDIYRTVSGGLQLMCSNNDERVRIFDCETFQGLKNFHFPWAVNHSSILNSFSRKLLAVSGDSCDILLCDADTGSVIETLTGHLDFNFATSFHPNGYILATGSQDNTCRLWDLRYPSKSLAVLPGKMGPIRSIRFSPEGQYMAMAESADFVHIFDFSTFSSSSSSSSSSSWAVGTSNSEVITASSQVIDVFGELSGISFTPDGECFYIGVGDQSYGGIMEFNRKSFSSFSFTTTSSSSNEEDLHLL